MVGWLGIALSKFSRWTQRLGTPDQHNGCIPRDFWLEDWEKAEIVAFHDLYPIEGYRRLAYMMNDANVVAVSPSTVYRVLKEAGVLAPRCGAPSRKGTGFEQPVRPLEHWHVDVAHLNICGTFYFLCTILDGYSRFVVRWEIRETMKEVEVETILQRAHEQFPGERPRVITDNGPQFVARDFRIPDSDVAAATWVSGILSVSCARGIGFWSEPTRVPRVREEMRRNRLKIQPNRYLSIDFTGECGNN